MPEIKKGKCYKCGKEVVANIPFIDGDLYGYKSQDHGCGEKYVHKVFRMTDKEIKEILE